MRRTGDASPGARGEAHGGVVGFADALAEVRTVAEMLPRGGSEEVPLWEAHGRVLAEAIVTDRDQPAFDRATRDGFAVSLREANEGERRGDPGARENSAGATARRWGVLGEIFAGQAWSGPPLSAGEAVEIMTGAPVPAGGDAVVMVEHVREVQEGDPGLDARREVVLADGRTVAAEANIVRRGSEGRAGQAALAAGTPLGPAEVALAASVGAVQLRVTERPHVAILSTGDELVEVGDPEVPELRPEQIRNSNSYALAALVTEAGGKAWRLPLVRDSRASLLQAVEQARARADLLLMTGGVSAGKKDLVEGVLLELGATFRFTGVRMQPGKPAVFGILPRPAQDATERTERNQRTGGATIPVFGLPGNPVSTEVTFRSLVEPLLRALCGEREAVPRFAGARLTEPVETDGSLSRFLPARLEPLHAAGWPDPTVRFVPWKSSGDLASNARANCYAVLEAGRTEFAAGDWVPVLLR